VTREAPGAVGVHSGPAFVEAFIGVGSNVDPEGSILSALPAIEARLEVLEASRFFRNPALSPDGREMPPFVNGVLRIRTDLSASDLKFGVLRQIEGRMGRQRGGDRFGPRTLDLDLLVYGDLQVEDDGFTLPDPDILVQPFWAVPLAELIPERCLPGTSLSLKEMVRTLDTRSFVYLEDFTEELRRSLRFGRC
jgi:2-amino-4-hydroxy-6-hydroxymethyldihydropteridine diphosphokinase